MNRNLAILALLLTALSSCVAVASPPNVLLILVDDLRTNLGCYGDPLVRTPHVDRLAAKGVRFERAYCQYPLCNPSRSSLLTGLRPDAVRVDSNGDRWRDAVPDAVTLPKLFRSHGYFTAQVGKIFHDGEAYNDPTAWDVSINPQDRPSAEQGEGRCMSPLPWCRWVAAEGADELHADSQTASESIQLLNQQRKQPLFLAVGLRRPHDPFVAPKRYFDLYPLEQMPIHRDPAYRSPEVPYALAAPDRFAGFTDRERREFLRAYYACTTFMDAQLGRILDTHDELDLWDTTVVLFVSDHGYHLGERGWWNKNTLFELSTRAPLIVWAPRMKGTGKATTAIVEFVDFYPTVAELAGLSSPADLEGRSFARLLNDPDLPGKQAAYTQVTRGEITGRSIRTDRYRYTKWDGGGIASRELYDHVSDPGEWHNLAADPRHGPTLRDLSRQLAEGSR
ncbi:MAG: sulfatase [Planctomycetaceae bacterium]|nr:sulfatase [Planctomycetaceae bacterium]